MSRFAIVVLREINLILFVEAYKISVKLALQVIIKKSLQISNNKFKKERCKHYENKNNLFSQCCFQVAYCYRRENKKVITSKTRIERRAHAVESIAFVQ